MRMRAGAETGGSKRIAVGSGGLPYCRRPCARGERSALRNPSIKSRLYGCLRTANATVLVLWASLKRELAAPRPRFPLRSAVDAASSLVSAHAFGNGTTQRLPFEKGAGAAGPRPRDRACPPRGQKSPGAMRADATSGVSGGGGRLHGRRGRLKIRHGPLPPLQKRKRGRADVHSRRLQLRKRLGLLPAA